VQAGARETLESAGRGRQDIRRMGNPGRHRRPGWQAAGDGTGTAQAPGRIGGQYHGLFFAKDGISYHESERFI